MSYKKIDFKKLNCYPIAERTNKVTVKDFVDPASYSKDTDISNLFPKILKGGDIVKIAESAKSARKSGKPVIWAMGAHLIKCGLSRLVIDLMERGIITAVAMNGAGAIHDYEIAMIGATSEDVAIEIKEGRFGMVAETGDGMHGAMQKYVDDETGMGEALGRDIVERKLPYAEYSIMAAGSRLGIPVTIHSAIGTEIIHTHPMADGALIGKATFNDFQIFTANLEDIGDGGVYFNVGSAVIMPEVFLKALSAVRNIGMPAKGFVTVNLDMVQHYRPTENVVRRPIQGEGSGYAITGHHEIMIPLIYQLLISRR
ncbi:MAG: hypothetical protein ABIJ24_00560 [Nitrospinota bacterium]